MSPQDFGQEERSLEASGKDTAVPTRSEYGNETMPVKRSNQTARQKTRNRRRMPLPLPMFYSAILGKPIAPVNPVTWARLHPTIAEYYRYHPPDFSGMKLYMSSMQYPAEYESVAMRSPATFSMGIVHSEMSKWAPSTPYPTILAIKGHALALMNQMIQDPGQTPGTDLALGIASLAAHDLVFVQDGGAAGAHLSGLHNLLRLHGGFPILDGHPSIQNLVHAVDGLHSYLSGKPRTFPVTPDASITAMDNPLRLAIQPTRSGFSQCRLRNHLLISIGAPLQGVLNNMLLIKNLARRALRQPYHLAPAEALRQIRLIESNLLHLGTLDDTFGLHPGIFSQEDRTLHYAVVRSARHVALLLLSCINRKLAFTPGAEAFFDYSLETLHMVNTELHRQDCHLVQFWAFFIEASLTTTDPPRRHIVARCYETYSRIDPGLFDWRAARACLDSIFYVPEVQDPVSLPLWREIERSRELGCEYLGAL